MTLFNDDRYNWRETYFVCFESTHRPTLPGVRQALKRHIPFLEILACQADEHENLTLLTAASYEDHAAMEIIYREGNDILDESKHLYHTWSTEATAAERVQLEKMVHCRTRFDVHHFEQTAATGVFNITKLPEIKFSAQSAAVPEHKDIFSKALALDKKPFHFDSDSYKRCRCGPSAEIPDASGMDETHGMENGECERINPEMLVKVLGILCRISRGIALDPASGIVLD